MIDKKQFNILIVDDTKLNIEILMDLLSDKYSPIPALNGEKALKIVEKKDINLILLDIMMPDMDGYEVCKRLKQNPRTKDIPVIFITAKTDEDSIEEAYKVGGVDYVTKPFKPREVLSRIQSQLNIQILMANLEKSKQDLRDINLDLEGQVITRTKEIYALNQEIKDTQKEIIFAMGLIGESRSKETGNHVKRVAKYSKILALKYGLSEVESSLLEEASPMHDIGKVGIPDAILNKPAKFTPEEFEIMKTHSQIGYDIFKNSNKELLKTVSIVAFQHHEKYDGSGYPQGLKGEEIHIYGRITALADVFDALGSSRVYKEAWDDKKIFAMFKEEKGKHFDPKLVDIFFENLDEILIVRDSLNDN